MKRITKAFAATMLASLVTACGGGGGGGDGAAMGSPMPPAAPATAGDAFTAAMVALVRSAPDDTEPSDVDGAVPTKPDGSEPVLVE